MRRIVHARGLRYRVNARPEAGIRRTADLLFTRARVAVFIDGCFWHGCPTHFTMPATNTDFWSAKINGNRRRDAQTTAALEDQGWIVLRFWEHERPLSVASRIIEVVREGHYPQRVADWPPKCTPWTGQAAAHRRSAMA